MKIKVILLSVLSVFSVASVFFVSACATTIGSSGGGAIKLPTYNDIHFKNGLQVLTIEDHSLPYVSVGLLIRSGSAQDPVGKSGLADLTSGLLDRGTKNHSATELADLFGNLGTSFGASTGYDYSYLSTSGLSQSQDELLDLFFEVVTTPSFQINEVDRLRRETISEIKKAYDQPSALTGQMFNQFLYGTHPYGRNTAGSIRDLKALKPKDIIREYLKTYRPNNAILVLVGDLRPGLLKSLEEKLGSWAPRPSEKETFPVLQPIQGQQILFVHRKDLKQSEVRFGHYGIKRKNEDFIPLMVANSVLSGGFTSRLMHEIRVKRALTYGIGGSFDGREDIGPFVIGTNTRNEKVGEVVKETLNVLKEYVEKGPTEQEVQDSIGYLKGAFPRQLETPELLARTLVALRFYGLSDDYLKNYLKNISKVSVKDVNAVIKKYYHPDNMKIMVYGPKEPDLDELRPLGAVEVKNYLELL